MKTLKLDIFNVNLIDELHKRVNEINEDISNYFCV